MTTALSKFICRLATPALCLAMFALIGGHLAAVQAVAWATMIRDYSVAEGSVLAGVEKTFSGEAPCELCLRVDKARRSQSDKPATLTANIKIDGLPTVTAARLPLPGARKHSYFSAAQLPPPSRFDAPPAPVPLSA